MMINSNTKEKLLLKRISAILALVLFIVSSLAFLQKYFCIPYSSDQNRAIMLHKEPENTIDVLFIGSSATYSGFSSVYAYEKFGFTSFPYAIGGATCTSWKPAVQDVLKKQKPKLVVVDVFGGGYELDLIESRNNQFYTIMSHTPLSFEKLDTARMLSREVNGTDAFSLLFPIAKYHNSVPKNLLSAKDIWKSYHSGVSKLKGVEIITRKRKLKQVDIDSFSDRSYPLDEKTETIIMDFISYCRDNNINVLFVKYPTVLTQEDPDELLINLKSNRILEIAKDAGFSTLNMQSLFHEIGLKEYEDYYNHGHTNTRGQKKVTTYLGSYIQENFKIGESSLDPENKKSWDDCISYYHAYCDLAEELINNGKYVMLSESPDLNNNLRLILSGTSVRDIAGSY